VSEDASDSGPPISRDVNVPRAPAYTPVPPMIATVSAGPLLSWTYPSAWRIAIDEAILSDPVDFQELDRPPDAAGTERDAARDETDRLHASGGQEKLSCSHDGGNPFLSRRRFERPAGARTERPGSRLSTLDASCRSGHMPPMSEVCARAARRSTVAGAG
jgi:hypothetical protein